MNWRMGDPDGIQEFTHSWYDYTGGKEVGLHPWSGETNLNYSGPQPPYDHLDVEQSYSWLKSPRWRGKAMEVGPLARVLMLYVRGHEMTRDLVEAHSGPARHPGTALFSDARSYRRAHAGNHHSRKDVRAGTMSSSAISRGRREPLTTRCGSP